MKKSLTISAFLCVLILAFTAFAQTKIPAPRDVLGFTPGDDRKLASWAQVVDYFRKLDAASDRVMFEEIGKTTEGKPFVYATISSGKNLKNLKTYKWANAQLADPRKFKSIDFIARKFIREGKTIVLITCGIHSTEVGSTLSSMLIAERLANAADAETQKILDNTIILLVPSLNPDGVDIVKNWYDKTLGTPFEGTTPLELYHKYVGHDNNRDWYAFTQIETQLTVDKIHNEWHPQIVHDIHQQGERGSRLFLPPYMQPVEPNVPKQIVEGFTELGNFMAEDLRKQGFQGITTNSTYDAWTPARAYSHYHGGVRILSETASAKLATPVTLKFEDLRASSDDGYDPKTESPNFRPVWKGGDWRLRDITNYMTTVAFSLLKHASDNREKWLTRFYETGKEAVRPRKDGELYGFILPGNETLTDSTKSPNDETNVQTRMQETFVTDVLRRAGVEMENANQFTLDGKTYPKGTRIIKMAQPYGAFAKAILENQTYPDLKDEKGQPIPPYDVTAHTLSLLTNEKVVPVYKKINFTKFPNDSLYLIGAPNLGCKSKEVQLAIYRSHIPSMDEGWTRWIMGDEKMRQREYLQPGVFLGYSSTNDKEIRNNTINTFKKIPAGKSGESDEKGVILFPDQPANQILNGYAKGTMPDEYTGGVGKEGVENLRKFVREGGTLVFLNRASNFAIEQFNLPVRDVTQGLPRKDFYIPGSILRTELDTTHPIARNMPEKSIAWFENSPAFEITTDPLALAANFRIIASYPKNANEILLSGWALGAERIAGKAALVEFTIGKGKIILFGFRPQYRGQSLATFPLLFNAISN